MKRLAVLISFSGDGGVERMITNLCAEFAAHVQVDLLALRAEGRHVSRIPPQVNLIQLKAKHSWTSVGEIAEYLRRVQPDALLVAKDRAGRAAIRARAKAGAAMPLWIRLGTNLSAALERKSAFNRWLRVTPMRRLYPLASGVIAVSEGVRQDTLAITGLAAGRVVVIRNPVITPALALQAAEPTPHPWLADKLVPVIIGMGRLTRQKDFPTLLRAFAAIQEQRPSRLILLGEGGDRAALAALAAELGITEHLSIAGFQKNPYAWLARADLFVLSSAWEGSPNALTEALALGVPCVSTRCPSGPEELLADGRYGPLVAVGDHAALAQAMLATLASPLPAEQLRAAVAEYRVELSAQRYLQQLGLA
ncbi:MAG: glycosyl transferase family 1 [Hydrocarboniphaga sp.]|uniref:glycosyltransferase n=1 Tax=Hydrocarboniphaga sp. TaxID=2033016 RepID=UPI00260AEB21|nr:glycosyltransferase [Hydrocarboniphaga sp.]MDB5969470.1 glycosyl transferase family 1 [Hydrocarboniphaga sp.]